MLAATWVLAGATVVIALAAPVAFITWLQAARRERERQAQERAIEQGKKEFASKDAVQIAIGAAVVAGLMAYASLRERS